MKHGRLADFFFAGLGVVPAALTFSGLPDLAILLFVPLLFVACLFGMAEQVEDEGRRKENDGKAGRRTQPRDAASLTFRKGESRKAKV